MFNRKKFSSHEEYEALTYIIKQYEVDRKMSKLNKVLKHFMMIIIFGYVVYIGVWIYLMI